MNTAKVKKEGTIIESGFSVEKEVDEMTIQQLYYLVVVADEGLISKAAYKLNISQSGLSQAINNIEQKLGFNIFVRSHAGIKVTANGELVLAHARKVLAEYNSLNGAINQIKEPCREVLRLAVGDEISRPFLEALLTVQEQYPALKVELVDTSPAQALAGVEEQKYDVAFLTYTAANRATFEKLQVHDCLVGRSYIYTTADNYLTRLEGELPFELLLEQEFVLYNDDQLIYEVDKLQKKFGKLNISLVTDNLMVIDEFLHRFQAVTLLRNFQLQNSLYQEKRQSFVPLQIAGFNFPESRYAWISRPELNLTAVEKQLLAQIMGNFVKI